MPMVQPYLTEAPWTMAELKYAVARLKANKVADDAGLVAELLHHSPEIMLKALLDLFRRVLLTGRVDAKYVQHVAENKGEQNQHPTFVRLLWSGCYTKHLRI